MPDTRTYSWADIDLRVNGVPISTAQAVSYKETQTKEVVYGKGNEPIGVQRGQKSYSEYEALVESTKSKSILDAHFDIVVTYGTATNGDMLLTDVLQGCEITDAENKMDNKTTSMTVELPLVFLRLKKHK